jgi:hypothetical protein
MANIRLKELVEANVDPKLVARSKETGKLVYFKNAQNKDAAMKAGTHLDPKDKKGDEPKADAKPNDMFGGDYAKDRGGEAPKDNDTADFNEPKARKQIIKDRNKLVQMNVGKDDKSLDFAIKLIDMLLDGELQAPNDNTDWMSDLDSIDTSDIKGKADPNADSFTSNDLYGATFKDPQTGKTITVGDAYEREDDSEAYKKAFAYVSKFDPDKEAVMGTQAYDDLNKKSEPTLNINSKNWKKTDGDGRMSSESADDVRNYLNDVLGVDGMAEVDFGSGNIQYGLADGENSIFVGNDGGTYNVSFEGPSMDLDKIEQSYKSFKNPKDALLYAGELAKANRKGLEQKQESTKLTSMIKK